MNTYDVVIGATRKSLTIPITNAQDVVIPLTGATAKLRGWSPDLPGFAIDLDGTVTDAAAGEVTFYSIGSLVDISTVGRKPHVTFNCLVEWQDAAGKDYTEELALRFVRLPDSAFLLSGSARAPEGHPWDFPFPTGDVRMRHAGPVVNMSFSNAQRVVLFSSPAGTSGIVRDLSWVASAGGVPPDLTLEVTVDGEATPCISIPLLTTVGMEHPASAVAGVIASTPAFEFGAGPVNPCGHFRLPMPYGNGIEIAVIAPAGAVQHSIWANVIYQDTLPGCWNSNLRLRAARTNVSVDPLVPLAGTTQLVDATHLTSSATLPADIAGCALGVPYCVNDIHVIERVDNTHAIVSSKDTALATLGSPGAALQMFMHEFLNRPAGAAGWLAMIVAAFENAVELEITFEGNVRLILDQHAEADLTWTSVEDFANGAFYFASRSQLEDGGVMSLDTGAGQFSVYKLFRNFPVRYADGIRGLVPLYAENIATLCNWTSFVYEETA